MKTRRQKSEEYPTTTDLTQQTRAIFENPGSDIDPIEITSDSEAEQEINSLEKKLDKGVEWDEQQNALIRIMGLINGGALQYESFYKGLNRLSLGIIQTALDLRSALVKNACLCIALIAMKVGQEIDLVGDFISPLISRVSHGTQIIAESSYYAIITIAKFCPSRRVMLSIFDITKSKGSAMKECAAEALKQTIIRWNIEILSKYSKQIEDTISKLISDANSLVRQKARETVLALQTALPKSADIILSNCDARTKKSISQETIETCDERIGSVEKRKRAPSVASTTRSDLSSREHRAPSLQPKRTTTSQQARKDTNFNTTTFGKRLESRADDRASTMSTPTTRKKTNETPLSSRRQKEEKELETTAKTQRSESVGSRMRHNASSISEKPKKNQEDEVIPPIKKQKSDTRIGMRKTKEIDEKPKTAIKKSAEEQSPRRPKTYAPHEYDDYNFMETRTSDLSVFNKVTENLTSQDYRPESRLSPRSQQNPSVFDRPQASHSSASNRKSKPHNSEKFESRRQEPENNDHLLEGEEPMFLETLQGDIDDGRVQELKSNIKFVVDGCLQCCSSNSALISSQALTAMKSLVTAFPSYFTGQILERLLDVLTESITVGNPRSSNAAQQLFMALPQALDINEVINVALKQVPSLSITLLLANLVSQGANISAQRTSHRLLNHAFKTHNLGDVKDRNTAGMIVQNVYKANKESVLRFIEGLRETQQKQFHDFAAPFIPELVNKFDMEIPKFSEKNLAEFLPKMEEILKTSSGETWNTIRTKYLHELNTALIKSKEVELIMKLIQQTFQQRGCQDFEIVVPGLLTQAHGPVNTKNADAALRLVMKVLKPSDVFDCIKTYMGSSDMAISKAAIDFCTRSFPKLDKSIVENVVDSLIPDLSKCFESPAPEVRKSVVMCFVELCIVLGKEQIDKRITHLSKAQQKLILIYYQRKTGN